eukprot:1034108-Prymnesium_polylepis.1
MLHLLFVLKLLVRRPGIIAATTAHQQQNAHQPKRQRQQVEWRWERVDRIAAQHVARPLEHEVGFLVGVDVVKSLGHACNQHVRQEERHGHDECHEDHGCRDGKGMRRRSCHTAKVARHVDGRIQQKSERGSERVERLQDVTIGADEPLRGE